MKGLSSDLTTQAQQIGLTLTHTHHSYSAIQPYSYTGSLGHQVVGWVRRKGKNPLIQFTNLAGCTVQSVHCMYKLCFVSHLKGTLTSFSLQKHSISAPY